MAFLAALLLIWVNKEKSEEQFRIECERVRVKSREQMSREETLADTFIFNIIEEADHHHWIQFCIIMLLLLYIQVSFFLLFIEDWMKETHTIDEERHRKINTKSRSFFSSSSWNRWLWPTLVHPIHVHLWFLYLSQKHRESNEWPSFPLEWRMNCHPSYHPLFATFINIHDRLSIVVTFVQFDGWAWQGESSCLLRDENLLKRVDDQKRSSSFSNSLLMSSRFKGNEWSTKSREKSILTSCSSVQARILLCGFHEFRLWSPSVTNLSMKFVCSSDVVSCFGLTSSLTL